MPSGAAAILGAGALSAGASIIGSQSAASAQESAANSASQVQQNMFYTTQANLQPYMGAGKSAINALLQGTGLSTAPATAPANSAAVNFSGTATPGGIAQGTYYEGNATGQNGQYPVYGQDGQIIAWTAAAPGASGSQQQPGQASNVGSGGTPSLSNVLNSPLLQAPTQNLSQAALSQTPGYQYALMQGLESTQNAAAARGLGQSGAALKAAGTYATGQAENTYQQQYENAVTNQTNQFNRLNTLASGGQNAAAGLGGIGQQTASNIGNNLVGAGNAAGASIIAGTNGVNNAINTGLGYNYLNGLTGNNANTYAGSNALAADQVAQIPNPYSQ